MSPAKKKRSDEMSQLALCRSRSNYKIPTFHGQPVWHYPLLDADRPGHVTCDACWEANSAHPRGQKMLLKTLPSLAVGKNSKLKYFQI